MSGLGSQSLARAWSGSASELGEWTYRHLVNRTDVWGGYCRTKTGKTQSFTFPSRGERGQVVLDPTRLAQHFRSCGPADVVGLHTTAPGDTSRWLAFDIDAHNEVDNPISNRDLANVIVAELAHRGYRSLLEDSNGRGGFHIWVIYDGPASTACVYTLGQQVLEAASGCSELFPKQPGLGRRPYGNWLRIPGRHHKHEHWSRFLLGDRWVEGAEAVAVLLNAPINSARTLPQAQLPASPLMGTRVPSRSAAPTLHQPTSSKDDIALALQCLAMLSPARADRYDTWIEVGMALHAVDTALLPDWDQWSRLSHKYQNGACAQKWQSFGGNGVGLGSLVHWKREDTPTAVAAWSARSVPPPWLDPRLTLTNIDGRESARRNAS